jgi:hypothetical protein
MQAWPIDLADAPPGLRRPRACRSRKIAELAGVTRQTPVYTALIGRERLIAGE